MDSAPGVQSAQEAISSSSSAEEAESKQPAAQQQQHHADHAASNIVGRVLTSAINHEEVPSAAAPPLPLPAPQKQQGQQPQSAGPLQRDFLADLLASSYTRHAPGTGDMRHDTEGWRCLETSFKVQRFASPARPPSLASFLLLKTATARRPALGCLCFWPLDVWLQGGS